MKQGTAALRTAARERSRIRALVGPYRRRVVGLSVLSFLSGSLEALFLVVVTRSALAIADDKNTTGLVAGVTVQIPWALAIAVGLLVLRLGCSLVGVSASTRLAETIGNDLRTDIVGTFLRSSWATQQSEPAGRLLQMTGFAGSAVGVVNAMSNTISALLNLAALLVIAIAVDPVASLVVIVALVGLGSVLAPIRLRIRFRSRTAARAQLESSRAVSEYGDLGLEMQIFGVQDRLHQRIDVLSRETARRQRDSSFLSGSLPHLYTTLAFGAVVLGLIVAASVGVRELSAIGAVMLLMLRSLSYGQQLQSASGGLASSIPFLEQLDATVAHYRATAATRGSRVLHSIGDIAADDVGFAYSPDLPVLRDVSFRIARGEIVGVIGPSGAGKSTLVQLLLGLREPTSGSITVGEVSLTEIDRNWWTHAVSFVPQDPHLFTGTVAENIRFFRDGITDDQVVRAAQMANVAADIEALPNGYATHLGERGVQLSGGQRQRLSIARALVGDPHLLVLDEPTSALDVHSESLIRRTVADLRGRVTVIVIAHRMSTLDMCDRLMVIEGGRLMAFDPPERLRSNSEFYRQALVMSGIA